MLGLLDLGVEAVDSMVKRRLCEEEWAVAAPDGEKGDWAVVRSCVGFIFPWLRGQATGGRYVG